MGKNNISLREKIVIFRQELDGLLEKESVNSLEVLKLSRMLDSLIAQYYSDKKVIS